MGRAGRSRLAHLTEGPKMPLGMRRAFTHRTPRGLLDSISLMVAWFLSSRDQRRRRSTPPRTSTASTDFETSLKARSSPDTCNRTKAAHPAGIPWFEASGLWSVNQITSAEIPSNRNDHGAGALNLILILAEQRPGLTLVGLRPKGPTTTSGSVAS